MSEPDDHDLHVKLFKEFWHKRIWEEENPVPVEQHCVTHRETAARNSQMQDRYNEWLSNLRVGENPRRKHLGHAFFITDPEADGHDWSPWRTRDLNAGAPCDCGAEKSGTTHAHWCSRMNDLKE